MTGLIDVVGPRVQRGLASYMYGPFRVSLSGWYQVTWPIKCNRQSTYRSLAESLVSDISHSIPRPYSFALYLIQIGIWKLWVHGGQNIRGVNC